MIHRSATIWQTSDWQMALKTMITDQKQLLTLLQLKPESVDITAATKQFPIKAPLHFIKQMQPKNPNDPLLLQVLARSEELTPQAGFCQDPLNEAEYNKAPGLVHKYPGRVLLISSPHCAIHCRYCFRRHFAYDENTPGREGWSEALHYIANDPSIFEVIFSGGDPLSSNDKYIAYLVEQLGQIPHIKSLRFHTRFPVVIPQRITEQLLDIFQASQLKTVMVLHINHAQEISPELKQAVHYLQQAGIRLLNQSVLLKGINDSTEAQTALLKALFELDIQAYYLHQLDKVQGASHFGIDDQQALSLYQTLEQSLPGFMLPRLVREIPSKKNKTALHFYNMET